MNIYKNSPPKSSMGADKTSCAPTLEQHYIGTFQQHLRDSLGALKSDESGYSGNLKSLLGSLDLKVESPQHRCSTSYSTSSKHTVSSSSTNVVSRSEKKKKTALHSFFWMWMWCVLGIGTLIFCWGAGRSPGMIPGEDDGGSPPGPRRHLEGGQHSSEDPDETGKGVICFLFLCFFNCFVFFLAQKRSESKSFSTALCKG